MPWPHSGLKNNSERYFYTTGAAFLVEGFLMAKATFKVCAAFAFVGLAGAMAQAQPSVADLNAKTLSLVAGDPAWFARAVGVADDVRNFKGLRVLPMAGAGCMQSAADVLRLEHVDMALLTTDCVAYAEMQDLLPGAAQKLAYVTRVAALPIVIVTRKNIPNLTALAGLRIATGPAQSAAFASGELLFASLGLPFKRVAKSGANGLAALVADEADAALLVGLEALDGSLDPKRFHVLGLPLPDALKDTYAPALMTAEQLQGLSQESSLESVSTALALVVKRQSRNAQQVRRIKSFISTYFENAVAQGTASELSANISGWQRHAVSKQTIDTLN